MLKLPKGWQLLKSCLPLCSLREWQTVNLFPTLESSGTSLDSHKFTTNRIASNWPTAVNSTQYPVEVEHVNMHTSSKHPRRTKIGLSGSQHSAWEFLFCLCNGLVLAALKMVPACFFILTLFHRFLPFLPYHSTLWSLPELKAVYKSDKVFCQIQFV